MTFLPIVERELRVASRRAGTFWLRFGAGLGVVVYAAWMLLMFGRETPQQAAQVCFYGLTGVALAVCLVSGLQFTADSMTEEKREGTLGLLFLTDLKGYDVVLGKLVANSLHAFYALLAALPVMAIPLLLGSFTLGHVVRVALALINALFFSLSLGMLASTIAPTTRRARGAAFGWLFMVAMGFPAIGRWISTKWPGSDLPTIFSLFSPAYTYYWAGGASGMTPAGRYWASLGVVHGLAWLFLILACVYAPRCWQDQPQLKTRPLDTEAWQVWLLGRGRAREAHRRRLLERNPFYWRAARARFMPVLVWAALGLIAGVWLWGWLKYSREWLNGFTYAFTALVLNALLKLGVAAEATRTLAEERRDGTLELLLSTPLSERDILRGQALALKRVFLLPFLVVFTVEIILMFAGLREMNRYERPVWLSVWIAGMLMLVADLIALYWVGMWRALAARTPKHASAQTVALVLVLPWVGFTAFLTLVTFLAMRGTEPGWETILAVWVVLGIAIDAGFGSLARYKLLTEFRQRAAERYAPRVSWWQRLRGVEVAGPSASPTG